METECNKIAVLPPQKYKVVCYQVNHSNSNYIHLFHPFEIPPFLSAISPIVNSSISTHSNKYISPILNSSISPP